MLLSTGIILSAFAGITYILLNKLEPDSAHAKVSYSDSTPDNIDSTPDNTDSTPDNTDSTPDNTDSTSKNTGFERDKTSALGHLAESGIRQSPINLVMDRALNPANIAPVSFHYHDSIIALKNTGHTIQADCDPANGIIIDGHHYTLRQFHFHARSEHLVDGRDYPMDCLLYTSPSPRDATLSRMPSSA